MIYYKTVQPLSPSPSTALLYENRSPLRLRNTELASYLLFSFPSVSGACLVAAGSALACMDGFPESSPCAALSLARISRASTPLSAGAAWAAVLEETTALGEMVGLEAGSESPYRPWACSSWYWRTRFWRSASAFSARSALMDFLAK
jgi:hypothetical protein